MTLLAVLVAIVLGLAALAFVLYPFFRTDLSRLGAVGATEEGDGEQVARTALQEVELDYQLSNIAEEDYRSLRERYMRRALVALKSRYDREQELDEEIEEQLRRLKEQGNDETNK